MNLTELSATHYYSQVKLNKLTELHPLYATEENIQGSLDNIKKWQQIKSDCEKEMEKLILEGNELEH